jgi:hypothetical protein
LFKAEEKFGLVKFCCSDEAAEAPTHTTPEVVVTYPENPEAYDAFAETMYRYLEMMSHTSVLIEDLYTYITDALHFQRENSLTVFMSVQW